MPEQTPGRRKRRTRAHVIADGYEWDAPVIFAVWSGAWAKGCAEKLGRASARAFAAEHRRLYGYVHNNRPIEIVAARVEAIGRASQALPESKVVAPKTVQPHGSHAMYLQGEFRDCCELRTMVD